MRVRRVVREQPTASAFLLDRVQIPMDGSCGTLAFPKVIHFVWMQGLDHMMDTQPRLAGYYKWNASVLKRAGWTSKVWNEEDGVAALKKAKKMLDLDDNIMDVYESAPSYAAKSDILRLAILYTSGGVYLDTDVLILQDDFDWVFRSKNKNPPTFFAMMRTDWNVVDRETMGLTNNCFIASAAHNETMAHTLQEVSEATPYRDTAFSTTITWTIDVTGPTMLGRVIKEAAGRSDVRMLPGSTCTDVVQMMGGESITTIVDTEEAVKVSRELAPISPFIHVETMSWIKKNIFIPAYLTTRLHMKNYWTVWLLGTLGLLFAVVALALVVTKKKARCEVKLKKCSEKSTMSETGASSSPPHQSQNQSQSR